MDFDLAPKFPQKTLFEGEGGSVKIWSSSELAEANFGAVLFVLQPGGFGLPHLSDATKIMAYVIQGSEGMAGLVLPNSSEELILKLKKGDFIPLIPGTLSWWYNNGDSEFIMLLFGETSKSYVNGEFTYFFLSGGLSNIGGFSSEFICQAFNLNEKEANKLTKSQTGELVIKLQEGIKKPENPHHKDFHEKMVYNIDNANSDLEVPKGGSLKNLTPEKFPFLEQAGLNSVISYVKLEAKAMFSPTYTINSINRLVYVVKGSGHAQIVGFNGKRVLDAKIEAGQLFLVPKYFSVAEVAGSEGLEFLTITTTKPVVEELATKKSVWNVFSPIASQVALNVNLEFEEFFRFNIRKNSIIIPPRN